MGDGAYRWCIVGASFLTHFLLYGVVYGIGVYYVVFEEVFHVGPTKVSVLCSVFTATFFTAAPVSAVLVNKYGCRLVMIIGGALGSLGLIASSFTRDINVLFFTFAGLTGVGLGFCGTPSIVIIGLYFLKRKPLAFGLSLSGVGLGAFCFPIIIRLMVIEYGLNGALLINGAICGHLILCGVIYGPHNDGRLKKGMKIEDAGFGQSVVFVHLAAYAQSLGFSKNEGAAAISVMGIANWLGRLFFGIIPQVKCIGFFVPFCVGLFLSAIMTASLNFVKNYISLCVICGAFGFTWGTFGALMPQTTLYVVGQKYLACAFGYLLVFIATGSILGAPAAGYIFETTESYPLSFYIGGAAILGSSIAAILPGYRMSSFAKRRKNKDILNAINVDISNEKHLMTQNEDV